MASPHLTLVSYYTASEFLDREDNNFFNDY